MEEVITAAVRIGEWALGLLRPWINCTEDIKNPATPMVAERASL